MKYISKMPEEPSFRNGKYFDGYKLNEENLGIEVDYIDMFLGHEFYQIETESIHIYHILEGNGKASINGQIYDLEKGDTIQIPVNTEFAFKGKLKMIEIMNPPYNEKTHKDTKKNEL